MKLHKAKSPRPSTKDDMGDEEREFARLFPELTDRQKALVLERVYALSELNQLEEIKRLRSIGWRVV